MPKRKAVTQVATGTQTREPGKIWTVIAGPSGGDIWADHIEAPDAKGAMLKVLVENSGYLLTDIIAVVEGKHQVIAPADWFANLEECTGCGKAYESFDIAGGRCVACGQMIASEDPAHARN